jgi:predicted RNase H-like nuclease (RuvC/YqgF family)
LVVPTPSAHKADNASHVDFIRPPERLHPTLSCWLKNMKKLSSLIDRLQELASAAPSDLRPQLHKQVAMLRSSFKKQQERCVEFLRLTEEYADRYLRDISAEIEQQRSFLDMLEKRLDMAKTLHGQAMDLRKAYESGTVDAMKVVRKAGKRIFELFPQAEY